MNLILNIFTSEENLSLSRDFHYLGFLKNDFILIIYST